MGRPSHRDKGSTKDPIVFFSNLGFDVNAKNVKAIREDYYIDNVRVYFKKA